MCTIFSFSGLHFDIDLGGNAHERAHRGQNRQTADHAGLDGTMRPIDARHRHAHDFRHLFLVFIHVDADDSAERVVLLLRIRRISHSVDVGQ